MKTRLKEIRKAKGFRSAKAFAESIGMQEKTYRNYEQGVRNLYLDVACELCTALGCTLDELVGRERPESAGVGPEERELAELYRRMDAHDRSAFLDMARALAFAGDAKKEGARRAGEGAADAVMT